MGQVHVRVLLTNYREALEELDLMVDCHRNRLVPYQGTQDQPIFRL